LWASCSWGGRGPHLHPCVRAPLGVSDCLKDCSFFLCVCVCVPPKCYLRTVLLDKHNVAWQGPMMVQMCYWNCDRLMQNLDHDVPRLTQHCLNSFFKVASACACMSTCLVACLSMSFCSSCVRVCVRACVRARVCVCVCCMLPRSLPSSRAIPCGCIWVCIYTPCLLQAHSCT